MSSKRPYCLSDYAGQIAVDTHFQCDDARFEFSNALSVDRLSFS